MQSRTRILLSIVVLILAILFPVRSVLFVDTFVLSSEKISAGVSLSQGRVKLGIALGDLSQNGYTSSWANAPSGNGLLRVELASRDHTYPVLHSIELGSLLLSMSLLVAAAFFLLHRQRGQSTDG